MAPSVPDLSRRSRGRWGEDRAAAHYRRAGYAVIDRNWRGAAGEVDLVVQRGATVVFCEVKARRTSGFGGPAAAVDGRKQLRLRRLAAQWLASHDVGRVDVRFDVVTVTGTTVEVIEAAF